MIRIHHILVALACTLVPAVASADGDKPAPGEAGSEKGTAIGGYGAPIVKVTSLASSPAIIFGSEGGLILNHWLTIGGTGAALVNDVNVTTGGAKSQQLSFAYGAGRIGFIIGSERVVHFSGGVVLGAGAVAVGDVSPSATFYAEPEAAAEFNLVRWLRLAVGGSYRLMPGNSDAGLTFAQLSGPAGGFALKFGAF